MRPSNEALLRARVPGAQDQRGCSSNPFHRARSASKKGTWSLSLRSPFPEFHHAIPRRTGQFHPVRRQGGTRSRDVLLSPEFLPVSESVLGLHALAGAFQNLPAEASCCSAELAITLFNEAVVSVDDRYDVSGLPEAQFAPGSEGQVLKNLLGITSKYDMDEAEASALERAMDGLVRTYGETHRFTSADLCDCHRIWLRDIYEWAGHYRRVNVSKDGFPFAAAAQVPALMDQFERDVLRRCTPCSFTDRTEVVLALAETHVDLVLIHPFRDGNGRLARMLSTLMALQAGLPLLDFGLIAGAGKAAYVAAIQAGFDKHYVSMERLFKEIIERSRASS